MPRVMTDACGTARGWRQHYRAGETACLACRYARALAEEDARLAPGRRALLDAEVAIYERRHGGARRDVA